MEENNTFSLVEANEFKNKVIQQQFNETDMSLIKLILSEIKGNTEDYLFDFQDLQKQGFDLVKNEKELFRSLKKIASYYIQLQNGYGDLYEVGLIQNKFTIDQETKILSIKINKELIPFLINLKEQYSTLQLSR